MTAKRKRPTGRSGAGTRGIADCLQFYRLTGSNDKAAIPAACKQMLLRLADVRRRYRYTVTPELSDALDTAADALSRAVDAAEVRDEH